jgi:hypothetical protein
MRPLGWHENQSKRSVERNPRLAAPVHRSMAQEPKQETRLGLCAMGTRSGASKKWISGHEKWIYVKPAPG